jgi:hypothetical protein
MPFAMALTSNSAMPTTPALHAPPHASSPDDHDNQDFAANLRLACSYFPSVSLVCRRLELNRTQFNRYLAGTSRPAAHTLRRMGDFFGIEPHEWWLPPAHFSRLLSVRPREAAEAADDSGHEPVDRGDHLGTLARMMNASAGGLDRYLGAYFEYYHSMSNPGRVLKSLLWLYRHDSGVRYVRIERLAPPGRTAGVERCRYVGSALLVNERIFLIDAEQFTGNELTQTILFPTYKSRVGRLAGLKLGVSAGSGREPSAARTVLEALGQRIDVRRALRQCGLLDPAVPGLDPDIVQRIDNRDPGSAWHFVGRA